MTVITHEQRTTSSNLTRNYCDADSVRTYCLSRYLVAPLGASQRFRRLSVGMKLFYPSTSRYSCSLFHRPAIDTLLLAFVRFCTMRYIFYRPFNRWPMRSFSLFFLLTTDRIKRLHRPGGRARQTCPLHSCNGFQIPRILRLCPYSLPGCQW